ncbi:hypothetical protein CTEN210_13361 [Chaetoceros tenuissimus]|uniref:Leucine-rich repeat domain-containing protein n=1 Tax=Chaetoceros tenuissimus TaxID=426638 RepID=A0AAD3HAY6_9STRA|nr:hypothetical protein CTEN210_13361 [Chaetoceros tenuissimus]
MAGTVKRIEHVGFIGCRSLEYVKLSRNLEYGENTFYSCWSLTSIFIPQSCRVIDRDAFRGCKELIILHVPQTTELGETIISETALIESSPFETEYRGEYDGNDEEVNTSIKNMNGNDEKYALHRACSSFDPQTDTVNVIVKSKGLAAFQKENALGITPLHYLEENPLADIDQRILVKRYILEMMGETI